MARASYIFIDVLAISCETDGRLVIYESADGKVYD